MFISYFSVKNPFIDGIILDTSGLPYVFHPSLNAVSSDQHRRAAGALITFCIEFCLHKGSYCEVIDRKFPGFPVSALQLDVMHSSWNHGWKPVIKKNQRSKSNTRLERMFICFDLFVSGCFCWHPACGSPSFYYDYVTIDDTDKDQSENDSNVEETVQF